MKFSKIPTIQVKEYLPMKGISRTEAADLDGRLDVIFSFLQKNRQYNLATQRFSYVCCLKPSGDNFERISAMLHSHFRTQARASLDKSEPTFEALFAHRDTFRKVRTVSELVDVLRLLHAGKIKTKTTGVLDEMWHVLSAAPGFGPKTAALFVKAITDVHVVKANKDLRFLEAFDISPADTIRLPVDSVITAVFKRLTGHDLNFQQINDLLFKACGRSNAECVIWDDLWFWGFITQRSNGDNRLHEWNSPKFWSIEGAPKEQLDEIRAASETFLTFLPGLKRPLIE